MATLRSRATEDLAVRMLARGARDKLVQSHTGFSAYVVREIRSREFGGSTAKSGPLPCIWGRGNASLFAQMHRSLLAALYRRTMVGKIHAKTDIENLIKAFDIYYQLAEPPLVVSFDEAWMIARELRGGSVEMIHCSVCAVDYLSGGSSHGPASCPYCAVYERTAGRVVTRAWRKW
jgi:hypothetical protein